MAEPEVKGMGAGLMLTQSMERVYINNIGNNVNFGFIFG